MTFTRRAIYSVFLQLSFTIVLTFSCFVQEGKESVLKNYYDNLKTTPDFEPIINDVTPMPRTTSQESLDTVSKSTTTIPSESTSSNFILTTTNYNITTTDATVDLFAAVLQGDLNGAISELLNGATVEASRGQFCWEFVVPGGSFCETGPILNAAASTRFPKTPAIISLLLDLGANVNALANDTLSPLHLAVANNQTDSVRVLLLRGADVNAATSSETLYVEGWTPLHFAAYVGNFEIAELLLNAGANVSAVTSWKWTALHLASPNPSRNTAILQLLLDRGVKIDAQTGSRGETALHCAVYGAWQDGVEFLLARGAKVNVQRFDGRTPLLSALDLFSCFNNDALLETLLDAGADVNLLDEPEKRTPLMYAAVAAYRCNSTSYLEVLLASEGVNIRTRDKQGRSALWYCIDKLFKNDHVDSQMDGTACIQRLLEEGLSLQDTDESGQSFAFFGCENAANAQTRNYLLTLLGGACPTGCSYCTTIPLLEMNDQI